MGLCYSCLSLKCGLAMIGYLQRPVVCQKSKHSQRGWLYLAFATSPWNDATCQDASRAGAAPLWGGRQPGAASGELAGRRSPAGVLEQSCFEEASAKAVFRLHLPSRPRCLSCLEQGRLSSPGECALLCTALLSSCSFAFWVLYCPYLHEYR